MSSLFFQGTCRYGAIGLVLFAVGASPGSAQWVHTAGPEGGSMWSLVMNGSTLFGATHVGIYRSTDYAATWEQMDSGPVGPAELATDGIHLAAGTDTVVMVSSNGGKDWETLPLTGPDLSVTNLAFNGPFLFVGTMHGLYRFRFDGSSWQAAGHILDTVHVAFLGVADSVLFARVQDSLWYSSQALRSTNDGETWEVTPVPLWLVSLSGGGSHLFAGGAGVAALSADSGKSWHLVAPFPWPTSDFRGEPPLVASLSVDSGTVWAGTSAALFRSTDFGASWLEADPRFRSKSVHDLLASGNHIFAASIDGFYFSSDRGKSWHVANTGLGAASVQSLAFRGNTLFAGTRSGAFRSTNGGSNWLPVDFGRDVGADFASFFVTGVLAFAGDDSSFYARAGESSLYYSADNGLTWRLVDSALLPTKYPGGLALFHYGGGLLANKSLGNPLWTATLYRSTDHGASWVNVLSSLVAYSFAVQDSLLLVACQDALGPINTHLYRSSDSGAHWEPVGSTPQPGYGVLSLAVHDGWLFSSGTSGTWRSSDHGESWVSAAEGLGTDEVTCFAEAPGALFVGSSWYGGGVHVSTDDGLHWKAVNEGLAGLGVTSLAIHDNTLYAGTSGGVWRRPLSELLTGVQTASGSVPTSAALMQNFPNPFNPSTVIRYALPERMHVTLTVYNILGQKVANLVSGDVSAGDHEVQFNAGDLASGTYFYRLRAGNHLSTRKMLILK